MAKLSKQCRKIVTAEELTAGFHQRLESIGMSGEHQQLLTETLVTTSLWGVDTHGVELIPTYIKELEGGRGKVSPNPQFIGSFKAAQYMDADGALGCIAGNLAMEKAIEMANDYGVGVVSVGNSNHYGAAGYYAYLAAAKGMVGLSMTNSDPLVAPFHGIKKVTGTNPLAMCAPGLDSELFLLDMATSQASYTKIKNKLADGETLEPLWALDAEGKDSSISNDFQSLLPLGGYKGQGLGMMVQMLSGVLSGMPFDHQLSHLYTPPFDEPRQVGHIMICLNIEAFTELDTFKTRISELLEHYRDEPYLGSKPVIVPGDREKDSSALRIEEGIPVSDAVLSCLRL